MHMTVVTRNLVSLKHQCPATVFCLGASRYVIRARQVVLGDSHQIDFAVITVGRAALVRRFVERGSHEKVWPGYDPFRHIAWETSLPANRPVILCVRLVPVLRSEKLALQIPELARLCSKLLQHPDDF